MELINYRTFLSVCKYFKQHDNTFFSKYFIDYNNVNNIDQLISKIIRIKNVTTVDYLKNSKITHIIFDKFYELPYPKVYFVFGFLEVTNFT